MKRLAFAVSALLAAASPLPVLAQEVAPQESAADLDTGTGAQMTPILGWSREMRGDAMVFTAPEGDATAAIVGVADAKDGAAAVATAWAKLDPAFEREVLIA